jgi:hypothetical protein
MNDSTRYTVYLTKYALSAGIIETQITDKQFEKIQLKRQAGEKLIIVSTVNSGFDGYFLDKELFLNKEGAIIKAEDMRVKKLASLEKSRKKLQELDFSRIKQA